MLHFESDAETSSFLQHYGLPLADGSPVLSREYLIEPENSPSMCRAQNLIESKLRCSVGELITPYG